MRIGILPALGGGGGVYQYSLTMLQSLQEWDNREDEFVVFAEAPHPILQSLRGRGWSVRPVQVRKYIAKDLLQRSGPIGEYLIRAGRQLRRGMASASLPTSTTGSFQSSGVELMLYPVPTAQSLECKIPYVMAIHDLQHRLQPEFPEVSANGQAERRECLYRNAVRNAVLLLADSGIGKEDILSCYGSEGITADRVKVLPFLPASYLADEVPPVEQQRVRSSYHLPDRYLFYPAQFWSHKNHARIVEALGLVRQNYGVEIPIVFSGSNEGEGRDQVFQSSMAIAHRLNIEAQIYYLGYVPDCDISALYASAVALVMPTFFGPTNIPVLEAWAFGCPVLTSGIRGIREQVGDAGILVDPRSAEDIGNAIYRLWSDSALRRDLSERGRRRLASYTPEDYRQRLIDIVNEAKARIGKH